MVLPIEKLTIIPFTKLWLKKAEGLENIPKNNGFIIAANHASYYETILIPAIIISETDKVLHAWVNSNYFRNPIISALLKRWGGIPVFKGKKEKNRKAFRQALEFLKNSGIMMIFPEGHRSPDGKLQKAYTGVARLALTSKAPVLPVGVIGSDKVMPRGKIFPRFKRCEVKIGRPIAFEKYYKKKQNSKILEEVARKVMTEIARLTNQEYNY